MEPLLPGLLVLHAGGPDLVVLDPWGWYPFHYGNWFFDAAWNSWCWSPGYVYSPAWVYWGYSPGYVGWCPTGWYSRLLALVGQLLPRIGASAAEPTRYFAINGTFATRGVDFRGWNFTGGDASAAVGLASNVVPGSRIGDRLGAQVAISSHPIVVNARDGRRSRGDPGVRPRGAARHRAARGSGLERLAPVAGSRSEPFRPSRGRPCASAPSSRTAAACGTGGGGDRAARAAVVERGRARSRPDVRRGDAASPRTARGRPATARWDRSRGTPRTRPSTARPGPPGVAPRADATEAAESWRSGPRERAAARATDVPRTVAPARRTSELARAQRTLGPRRRARTGRARRSAELAFPPGRPSRAPRDRRRRAGTAGCRRTRHRGSRHVDAMVTAAPRDVGPHDRYAPRESGPRNSPRPTAGTLAAPASARAVPLDRAPAPAPRSAPRPAAAPPRSAPAPRRRPVPQRSGLAGSARRPGTPLRTVRPEISSSSPPRLRARLFFCRPDAGGYPNARARPPLESRHVRRVLAFLASALFVFYCTAVGVYLVLRPWTAVRPSRDLRLRFLPRLRLGARARSPGGGRGGPASALAHAARRPPPPPEASE